jgi:hypothetical protein
MEGEYAVYTQNGQDLYPTTWSKPGYGSLPSTEFPLIVDGQLNAILPPVDNIINNGDFESGSLLPGWIGGGTIPPTIDDSFHTGQTSLLLGQESDTLAPEIKMSNTGPWNNSHVLISDDMNKVHLLWVEGANIFYNWRSTDGNWHNGATFNPGSPVGGMQAKIDGNGIVHVVWAGQLGLYYAKLNTNSGNWTTPVLIRDNNGETFWSFTFAINNSGDIHVAWEYYAEGWTIAYSHRQSNGSWSAPKIFNQNYGDDQPHLAVAGDGAAHLVWAVDDTSGYHSVMYAQRSPNGEWSESLIISKDQYIGTPFQLVLAESGVLHVAWSSFNNPGEDGIYYTFKTPNNVWSDLQRVSGQQDGGYLAPIRLDRNGGLHLAWLSGDTTVYYAFRDKYGTWYQPQLAGQVGSYLNFVSLDMVVGKNGRIHIVKGGGFNANSNPTDIYYLHQLSNGMWSVPQILTNGVNDHTLPQILVDDSGSVHITWIKQLNTNSHIYYTGSSLTDTTGDSRVTQYLTVPLTITTPILSFVYQLEGVAGDSSLGIQIDDGNSVTSVLNLTTNTIDWTQAWADLTQWRGQAISTTFNLEQAAQSPIATAYLDDVTVGSTYPDVWVAINDSSGGNGQQIVHEISYGNRGGAIAQSGFITYTLPPGLSFISSSISPIATTPAVVWQIDELPAKGDPFVIEVVVMVKETAVPFTTLTSTVEITTDGTELEMLNNVAEGSTYIGRFIYLPFISKN